MKFSYQFPLRAAGRWERWIGNHALSDLAVAAEESGFDLVSATDHPFPTSEWIGNGGHHSFDPFVALSFMAAATSRIRLLTMVLVAGYRNPYLAAKSAASLDNLSGGRLVLGTGAGYLRPEFDALGAQFENRGTRLAEAIDAMRQAWTGDQLSGTGGRFPADGHEMLPRPRQHPGPPVWIGGNSVAASRRAARHADGWIPFEQTAAMSAVTGSPALTSVDLAERIAEIRSVRAEAGLPEQFSVCYSIGARREPADTAELIMNLTPELTDAGVTHVALSSTGRTAEECLTELEVLGELLIGDRGSRPAADLSAQPLELDPA